MPPFQVSNFNKYIDSSKFIDFCRQESLSGDPAAVNMWSENWQSTTETLPYLLFFTNRFSNPNGEFFLLKYQKEIIGCSGIYISEFSKQIAIAGCRTWIKKEFRNCSLMRDYLLPVQRNWTQEKQIPIIALTFNEYNKGMINIWKRTRFGELRTPRAQHHIFYNNFNEVEFPIIIQHTKQWVIFESLSDNFNFDWSSIRFDNL